MNRTIARVLLFLAGGLPIWLCPAVAGTYSRTETIEYHDDTALWVLGQIKKVTCVSTSLAANSACDGQADSVISQTDYGWKALPWKTYAFGQPQQTFSYETSLAAQVGTLKTVTDGNGNVTTLGSWKRGIPQSIKYPPTPEAPGGAMQVASVSDEGWIRTVNDENGYRTCYDYDDMGRVERIRYPSETTASVCDPGSGAGSAWAETTITFARSSTQKYGLPANHWQQMVSTGAGRKVVYFDALWRPVIEEVFDSTSSMTTTATRSLTVKRYDAGGRLGFQSYAMPSLSNFTAPTLTGVHTTYDALDRVRVVDQDWEGSATRLRTTTSYLSNADGNYTLVTDPNLNQTRTWYQAFDQPRYDAPTTIWHPENARTHITRDPFDKVVKLRRSNSNATTGGSVALDRHYVYDVRQRLCKAVEPETGATIMQHDGAGNLAWSANAGTSYNGLDSCHATHIPLADRTSRTYDARNRIQSLVFPGGLGNTTYTYTRDGKLDTIMADNGGSNQVTTRYSYNRRRLPVSERMLWGSIDWSIDYGYDRNGHLATQAYPGNAALTLDFTPNALGQPTQSGTFATGVTYFPNGAVKQFTYGNGIVHRMEQNARQLPERSVDFYGSSVKRIDDYYDYDKNGNVLAITDALAGGSRNRDMTYDGLDRLTKVVSPAGAFGTASYSYDVLDNLTKVQVGTTPTLAARTHFYCYDSKWRLTNVKTGSCAGATVLGLGYDAQGNLSNRNGRGFTFDHGNRLRTVSASGSVPVTGYVYDGHGRRTRDCTGGCKYSFYNQTGQLTFVSSNRTSEQTQHVHLGGSLVATRKRTSGGVVSVEYQHTDALGSPVVVTNANRAPIEQVTYEPYGRVASGALRDEPGYTGHVEDAATGLNYMQQRYYDPMLGVFLSVDPVTAYEQPISQFHRYRYANNNPYKFTDPDGRQAYFMSPPALDREGGKVVAEIVADFTPGISDAKGIYDAYKEPTPFSIAAAVVGLGGPVGDGLAKGIKAAGAAVERAKNIAKGIPESRLGPSGKPKVHSVQHSTTKGAREAAQQQAPPGGNVRNDAHPQDGQKSHFQAEDAKGENVKPVVHHCKPNKAC